MIKEMIERDVSSVVWFLIYSNCPRCTFKENFLSQLCLSFPHLRKKQYGVTAIGYLIVSMDLVFGASPSCSDTDPGLILK
jgi:hypothetical protein